MLKEASENLTNTTGKAYSSCKLPKPPIRRIRFGTFSKVDLPKNGNAQHFLWYGPVKLIILHISVQENRERLVQNMLVSLKGKMYLSPNTA